MTFHEDEHKINNTGWIWNGDETEGWNEAKPKGNAERFFNLHFLDQKWSKDLEFALAKLRGLCKYLASVHNSHSHVYGLHRLILCTKTKQENQCNEASRLLKELSVISTQNMEKSPSNWIYYIAAKTTTSFMKRNERENKKTEENAIRLIVHSITHRGEIWRGEGGREVKR